MMLYANAEVVKTLQRVCMHSKRMADHIKWGPDNQLDITQMAGAGTK